jgi:LPS O-antigen subunit length determinant protein (WzzB/FepE family)
VPTPPYVAFGCSQLRYLIAEDPDRIEEIHEALDIAEQRGLELGVTPERLEPFLILRGGGVDQMDAGMEKFAYMRKKIVQEYLQRCHSIGVGRQHRCLLNEAKEMTLI